MKFSRIGKYEIKKTVYVIPRFCWGVTKSFPPQIIFWKFFQTDSSRTKAHHDRLIVLSKGRQCQEINKVSVFVCLFVCFILV
jgi:hypothetical protein